MTTARFTASRAEDYPRDMVGYGPNLPGPKWPNGATHDVDRTHCRIAGKPGRFCRVFWTMSYRIATFGCAAAPALHAIGVDAMCPALTPVGEEKDIP